MRTTRLLQRRLAYYWQTNFVVVLGVATAVAVLAGALLIGESVRGSLQRSRFTTSRQHGSHRRVDRFLPRAIGDRYRRCSAIALEGVVEHEPSHRRAGGVRVYGVDEQFCQFNGVPNVALENRAAWVSEGLATELGSHPGESLLLRLEKPSDIPIESLHGRKDDPGQTIRLNMSGQLPRASLGEFSLQPQQGVVRAIFVSLRFLQRELEQQNKVNTIIVSHRPINETQALLREKATIEDLGLKLRNLGDTLSLESNSNLIDDSVEKAAHEAAHKSSLLAGYPVFSYLANSISAGERSIPYSLVTAVGGEPLNELGEL